MIRWIWYNGYAHALVEVAVREKDEIATWKSACGIEDDYSTSETEPLPDIREAPTLTARPFGADSDPECHGIVKRWLTEPDRIPEGAIWEPAIEAHSGVMSRDERANALRGVESVSIPGGTAPAPARPVRSRRTPPVETGDDLEFPDEPAASAPVVDGALVVAPAPRSKRSRKAAEIDDEIEV